MALPKISLKLPTKSLQVPLDAVRAGLEYLARHPTELVAAARHAAELRVDVPLDALRWLLGKFAGGKNAPRDVVLGARPPAITIAATVELMGNAVRVSTAARVEELKLGAGEIRLALRLSDFAMQALDPKSPIAQFLKSPSLDLSKPANLVNMMPKRPKVLVEAKDDLIVLDLGKLKKLEGSLVARKVLAVLAPVLAVPDVSTEEDRLLVAWRPRMDGWKAAVAAIKA